MGCVWTKITWSWKGGCNKRIRRVKRLPGLSNTDELNHLYVVFGRKARLVIACFLTWSPPLPPFLSVMILHQWIPQRFMC